MLSRRAFALIPASLFSAQARSGGTALWVSGEVPPFLRDGKNGAEGYAYEIFQAVLKQAGLQAELRFYPWARALRMLEVQQAQAALVIARTADREARFRWLFPVGNFRFVLVTRAADDRPVPADVAGLRKLRVGSMRASASRSMLAEAGASHVVEGKDYNDLIALLRRGVVDAIIGPDSVMRSLDTAVGGGDLRMTLLNQNRAVYAAAAEAMPEENVARLRTAYQQLVDSGFVAQLRKRHPDAFFDD
ncbi:polar amino acid transport system substrate-binding protein [Pelomonas saccharophila]|uniref:Polar amino acid transport system substrate-binding protein n=1 Tax=Roseateles saccharophilus TaxID=304 RepID=A0ABU1YF83_ROSSA|nr:transporter substrate-binding domain-containing protein [Roseateles saccharophilus]MDR7267517.1 polar amino acid transport system substrate-binding protein [Roseateles saccharophilus]